MSKLKKDLDGMDTKYAMEYICKSFVPNRITKVHDMLELKYGEKGQQLAEEEARREA